MWRYLEPLCVDGSNVVPTHPLGFHRTHGVPPYVVCRIDEPRRDEEARGQIAPPKFRRHTMVVEVSVVERDREVSADVVTARQLVQELPERHDREIPLKEVAEISEFSFSHGDRITHISIVDPMKR